MNISEWLQLLWQQIEQTTWLEWAAVGFGVTEVLLAKANKIWLYPAGLISSACAIILLYEAGLFAECMLSFYYVIMSIYGWWHWHKRKNQPPVKVKPASKQDWAITAIISFGGWALLYVLLSRFTSSNVPILDAVVSSTAWAGTWLLSKRKIENWLVLNVSNIIAIPLLWYKHLPLMAMLTLFLFIVAVLGYFDWKKIYRKESKPANANISSHAAYPAV